MADKLDTLLQSIVNLDYSQLLAGAKEGLSNAYKIFGRVGNQEQATSVVVAFLAAAIAVDGTFTALEQKLINDIFGDVDFMRILKTVDADMINDLDELIDTLSTDDKSKLCLFAAYILAVDEHINKDEYRYLLKLID